MNTTITTLGGFQRSLLAGPARFVAYAEPSFADRLRDALGAVIAQADTELVSLDVFDTVMLRPPTCELRRFAEIAAIVAQHESPHDAPALTGLDVLIARLVATRSSYRLSESVNGYREGTLTEIAAVTAAMLGLDVDAGPRIVRHELAYEESVLETNHAVVDIVKETEAAGHRVVYLSDMYLDAGQIRRLLSSVCGIESAEVLSSADAKLSKQGGAAYTNLSERTGIDPSAIVHIGDSLRSDYQQARRSGIRALHLPIPDCEREEIAIDHQELIDRLSTLGVDVSRWKAAP